MNKDELARSVASKTGLLQKQSREAIDAVVETITDTLLSGEIVRIVGFGTFEAKNRAARKGRDMRKNETIIIPERKIPRFVPSDSLKLKFKE